MLDIVIESIAEHLNLSKSEIISIEEDTKLKEDLKIDSLDAIEISMILEEKLDIEFEESDMDGVVTIGDLVKVVEKIKA